MTTGEIVEMLINIRGEHRLARIEDDAVCAACNILDRLPNDTQEADAKEMLKSYRAGLPAVTDTETLRKAIEVYGEDAQIDVAIEEMSELIRALLKYRRAGKYGTPADVINALYGDDGISEETADVIIMLTQLLMIFRNAPEVRERTGEKVNRLKSKLEKTDSRK